LQTVATYALVIVLRVVLTKYTATRSSSAKRCASMLKRIYFDDWFPIVDTRRCEYLVVTGDEAGHRIYTNSTG